MASARRTQATTQKLAATTPRTFRTFMLMQQFAAEEVGARIAQARNEAGLTQEELAAVAPFGKRSLQDYEAGVSIPYRHMRFLSSVLSRPVEWFLRGDEDQPQAEDAVTAQVVARLDRIERALQELVARSDPDEPEARSGP